MIGSILFYAGFLLILLLFTEEFARAAAWLKRSWPNIPGIGLLPIP